MLDGMHQPEGSSLHQELKLNLKLIEDIPEGTPIDPKC